MSPAATLPSLSDPGILAFGAALGAFAANTVARLLRRGNATRLRWSVEGSYVGTAICLGAYLIGNAPHISIF
jgi:carbon monoxide dehydrogenase subunit G